jgi:hypothetical protein
MLRDVHSVVKEANYVDDIIASCPVYEDMSSPSTMTGNVHGPDSGSQNIPRDASENFRTEVQFGDGGKDCRFVDRLLMRAETFASKTEDT